MCLYVSFFNHIAAPTGAGGCAGPGDDDEGAGTTLPSRVSGEPPGWLCSYGMFVELAMYF